MIGVKEKKNTNIKMVKILKHDNKISVFLLRK